jgi:DNA invertase Pin-like site-specific DNA recombinase
VIYEDSGASGAVRERSGLAQALARTGAGDVLTVWKLDRLGRSLPHLIELLDGLGKGGAGFQSLSESIDTTTAGGRLIFHKMGTLAEFERELIAERTRADIQAAKRRDLHVGRPRKLTARQLEHARELIGSERETKAGATALLGGTRIRLGRLLMANTMSKSEISLQIEAETYTGWCEVSKGTVTVMTG